MIQFKKLLSNPKNLWPLKPLYGIKKLSMQYV